MIAKSLLTSKYKSGLSMPQIAKELHCSVNKIVYWMRKHHITRRSHSESAYIQLNPNGDPFTLKTHLTRKELFLFGIAIGIYLGEGNKVEKHSLRVSNTDPHILHLFLQFLKQICQFDSNRISYSIVAFNDSNIQTVRSYWANQFNIAPEKFGKITQIPPQGKGTYRHKSQFGVCTVQANNIKLTTWFRKQVQNLNTQLSPR